jgi:hypothetical protein
LVNGTLPECYFVRFAPQQKELSMKKQLFSALCLLMLCMGMKAQTNLANYTFAKSAGTYVPLAAGASTYLATWDNSVSGSLPLGGTFTFGGAAFTSCYISSNGYIGFGAAPGTTNYTPMNTLGSTTGAIAAYAQDGASSTAPGSSPVISYMNIGGATGEFVVQFQDHSNFYNRSVERLNFQIRLNLATGAVNIVYGSWTAPGTSASGIAAQIGIRGNTVTWNTNVNNLTAGNIPAGTTCSWSDAVTGSANNSTLLFSSGNTAVVPSNGLTFTWAPPVAPVAPVRVFAAVTATTLTSANLAWTAPSGATQYNVQYRIPGTCTWTNFSGNPVTTPSVSLTGLTQSTVYQVRVQSSDATNNAIWSHIPDAAGTGDGYSTAGTFRTLDPACITPTAQATALTFGGITNAAVNGTFTPVAFSSTPGYLVIRTLGTAPNTPTNGVTYTTGASAPLAGTVVAVGTSSTFATTGLAANTNYSYYIYTYSAVGCSAGPLYYTVSPLTGTVVTCPATPGTGTVSATTQTAFNLAWGSSVGGGGATVTYTVDVATNNTFASPVAGSPFVITAPTSSVSIPGLTANTQYFYRIMAGNGCNTVYTSTASITTACNALTTLPFFENFEGVTAPAVPSCWTVVDGNSDGDKWISYNDATYSYSGTKSVGLFTDGNGGANNDWLITPQIVLTGNQQLKYWIRARSSSEPNDYTVKLSTTGTSTSAFTTTLLPVTSVSNTAYAEKIISLSGITGTVSLAFHVPAGGLDGWYLYIDDVTIENIPTCYPPTALANVGTTTSTGTFSWTAPATGTPASYEYEIRTSGAAGSGATGLATTGTVSVPTTSAQATGLSSGTSYSVYVRSNCGAGDVSAWTTTPLVFATVCNPVSIFPFFENFETAATPAVPNCWTVLDVNNDGDKWITYNDATYAKSGTKSVGLYTDGNGGSNNDWLITPEIVLTGNQQLKYWIRARSSSEPNDYTVKLSAAGTATAAFTNTLLPVTSVSNTAYVEKIINLTGITGTVNIAFHVPAGGLDGWYLYIDDVTIERIPTCFPATAITATNTTINTVDLGWTAPATGTPVNYVWEIRTSGAAGSGATGLASTGTVVAPATSVTATGLSITTSYSVYVLSDCGSGDFSTWSTVKTFTTPAACPAPTTATVTNITGTRAVATWTAGATETAWDVYYGPTPLTAPTSTTVPTATVGTTPSYTMTPLTPTTGYAVYVRANCGVGNTSIWSAVRNFTTTVSCPAPTNVVISAITPTAAVATWTVGGAETNWFVNYSSPTTTVVASGTPSYTMTGLTPSTTYSIQVKGICGASDSSAYTTLKTFVTLCQSPNITSTTPGTRCGVGTTTLGATGDPGATLQWYTAPTGGAAVGTGSVFTTPTITNTTNYYVTATGGLSTSNVGLPSTTGAQGTNTSGAYLIFDALSAFTLNSVVIYPGGTGAGNIVIALQNSTGTTLQTATISATGAASAIPQVATLNFAITPGTAYRLVYLSSTGGVTSMYRELTGTVYPFTLPGVVSITSTSLGSGYYYYFYNWSVSTGCESARTAVAANVSAPPALALTATTTVCANVISTVSVTSTASNYDSYVWSPVTNLYTDAAATVPYAGGSATTLYYKSATAGSTTYNVNASNSVSGCANVASTILSTSIPVINASLSPTVVCSGAAVTLSATTNAITTGTATFGSGATTTAASPSSPLNGAYGGMKAQYILRAADLIASGVSAGNITSLSINVTAAGATVTDFAISMGTTTLTAFGSATDIQTGVSPVYSTASFVPVVGNNVFTFSTPFNWNGTSNIIVSTCWSNNNTSNASTTVKRM